jgi:hypothetical protein
MPYDPADLAGREAASGRGPLLGATPDDRFLLFGGAGLPVRRKRFLRNVALQVPQSRGDEKGASRLACLLGGRRSIRSSPVWATLASLPRALRLRDN